MELFETYFEDEEPTVAREFFAELHESWIDHAATNFRKNLQNIRDKAKEAKTKEEIEGILKDARLIKTRLERIIEDNKTKTAYNAHNWEMVKERLKVMWPMLIAVFPYVIGALLPSSIKEKTKEIQKERLKQGVNPNYDVVAKKIFLIAKDNIEDATKLVSLLEAKLKKAK